MTTMSKPIIIGAAVPALLLMGAGCGESEKKCSQITSKAQCGKGCQWKPNNATSSCKQNNTMFNKFFNFSEASDFFYQKEGKDGKPKTVHDLKEELKELRANLDVESKDHNDDLDLIEWKEWLIEQKNAGGHDLSKSEEVFKRCAQAPGIWRRQLEDAQTNRTAVYPIQYQEFVDEFKNLYDKKELSFKVHLPQDGAGLRHYLRTTGLATRNEKTGKITLAGKDDKGNDITHDIANEEDFNRLGVVLNAMAKKCHKKGGLVSQSREGDIACVTLPEYLKREDHADSIDGQHHCEEANKRAQEALYDGKTKKEDDSIPTLFKWEDKCVVAQPCEFIWKPIDKISAGVDKDYKYCKAKLDRKTEDTNVQCTLDNMPRKGNECVVDNKRKICGYYGTQSPDHLEIGAGICQLVNANAADSPGRCSDIVKKAPEKENKSSSDADKQKKEDKGRI